MSKARDIASAIPAPSTVSSAELGFLDGVTSAIQTQIDSKIGSASAINPTIVDAKGDIIAATAADTVARLAVGANDTVLTADSSAATGLKWAAPAGGGGMTLLSTTSLSGSSSVTVSSINQSYVSLVVFITNFYAASIGNLSISLNSLPARLIWNGLNVAVSDGINTMYTGQGVAMNTGFSIWNNTTNYGSGDSAANYTLEIPNYSSTTAQKSFFLYGGAIAAPSTNWGSSSLTGRFTGTVAIDSITFSMGSNFGAGTVQIYGVK